MAEEYIWTVVPRVPRAAQNLALSGTIAFAIEQPVTDSYPWPTRELSLGDFSYSIDLRGWWPGMISEEVD